MAITNPLDLPEIREALAPYLSRNDFTRCIRVCDAWRSSFYPFLWTSVDIHANMNKQPLSDELKKHRTLVRRLVYHGQILDDHLSIHYPALRTLLIYVNNGNNGTLNTIVNNHPSLSHLELRRHDGNWCPNWIFPDTLSNLSTLRLISVSLRLTSQEGFWRVCSLLETLDLQDMYIDPPTTPPETPWKVKDLTMVSILWMTSSVQLSLIRQCPELRRLQWCPRLVALNVRMFIPNMMRSTWPMLEDLQWENAEVSDQALSRIIGNMQRVTGFCAATTYFNVQSMSALRNHFHCLRRLNITGILGDVDDNIFNEFTIEVLKSCPQLESLKARAISADCLMDNAPWACEITLRILEVSFEIKPGPDGDASQQEAVMERLSRLVNLERLDVSNNRNWRSTQLSRGLKKLATLTELQDIVFPKECQLLSLDDVEWIIEHWRNLKSIQGVVGWKGDSKQLIIRFSEARIETCKLSIFQS
jgi:hypothetical protein